MQPRLSWILDSKERGQRQTAYQVLVASSKDKLDANVGDLWDSGKIASNETLQIRYEGKSLGTAQQAFWKSRVWDVSGNISSWSSTARWTMGLVRDGDWTAPWVGADDAATTAYETMLLRRSFPVKRGLSRALAFICGLGQYELHINGHKVGDDLLAPGWTKYDKTCLYDTHDITAQLKTGKNAVGLLLGNGMYNVRGGRYAKFTGSFGPIKATGMIRLEYTDGTVEYVVTDHRWKIAPGPITFSCVYGGEDYDARLAPAKWDHADFNDTHWKLAHPVNGPGGRLRGFSAAAPPIRAFETFSPVVHPLKPGVEVYDLGQNAAFMPRLTVHGPAGGIVKIIPAELLHPDGRVNRGSVGNGESYWKYTLSGVGKETYFPHFFYHGCRYFQVELSAPTGAPLPVVDSLTGVVVGSDSPPVGKFHCSNDLFNRIYSLIRWAQRSNMVSILTDCPHRERLGWLEEYHLNGPSLRYNFDLDRLFGKIMNDMVDSQTSEGLIPDIAPEYVKFEGGFRDSPEWGSALLLIAWQQYEYSGDSFLLEKNYDAMKRYINYLSGKAKNNILDYGLGDWYDLGPKAPGYAQLTPIALTATAFYYQDALVMAKTAALLGKKEDRQQFETLAAQIKEAFHAKFWNASTDQYATGSQCSNALPLVIGLAPAEKQAAILRAIVSDVQKHGNSCTAGDVGYRYLLQALAEGGRSDVIFAMNNQSNKPGYVGIR